MKTRSTPADVYQTEIFSSKGPLQLDYASDTKLGLTAKKLAFTRTTIPVSHSDNWSCSEPPDKALLDSHRLDLPTNRCQRCWEARHTAA